MARSESTTKADPQGRSGWHVDDLVVRLRLWGTEHAYRLPEPRVPLRLGSSASCAVQLHDDTGLLSREHAMLDPSPDGWELRDLGSKNGLKIDGVLTSKSALQAGAKIQLGGLILVAESFRFIELRSLICRFMGWSPERQAAVDEALQNLRDCMTRHTPLVLLGDEELDRVALQLHQASLGPEASFVAHEGGDLADAIQASMHGTLCIPGRRREAVGQIARAVHAVSLPSRPCLVVCARNVADAATVSAESGRVAVITVPELSERTDEVPRLVREVAADVVRVFGLRSAGFTIHDLERLHAMKFSGMADLEDAVRRVIAMRTWGVTAGARRLGLKHSSLSQWARNRNRRLST